MKKMLTIGALLFCSMFTQITRPIESELIRRKFHEYKEAVQRQALKAEQATKQAAQGFTKGAKGIGRSFSEGAKAVSQKLKFW